MSISLRRVSAIFRKQLSDFYRNPNIMISALLAPLFALLYMRLMPSMLPDGFLVAFVLGITMVMNFTMVGFMMMTNTIAEEKEKNTLRVLMLAGVKPAEFLLGNGLCTILVGFAAHLVLFFLCGAPISALPVFALCGLVCLCASATLGATVGVLSKNQMNASIIAVPVLLLLMLLPIFGNINEGLGNAAKFVYTSAAHTISNILLMPAETAEELAAGSAIWEPWLVILANLAVFVVLFALVYRKNRKDD